MLIVAGGSVLPCLGRGDGHCSLCVVGTDTPESPQVWALSCRDAEGEGRSTIPGRGKAAGAERFFAND